jgi:Ferritin-like domain
MSGDRHRESSERPRDRREAGRTRAQALRATAVGGAVLGAGALVGGLVNPQATAGRPSRAQDVRILNFLLVLEEMQAAFYAAALRGGALRGDLLQFARTVAPQEREHVDFVRMMLGREARAGPELAFGEATSDAAHFRAAAIDLEEATAAAYIGQGASLTRPAVQDAARIVAVEARHAAWIRDLAGTDPAPRAADVARSADDVLSGLRQKGLLR